MATESSYQKLPSGATIEDMEMHAPTSPGTRTPSSPTIQFAGTLEIPIRENFARNPSCEPTTSARDPNCTCTRQMTSDIPDINGGIEYPKMRVVVCAVCLDEWNRRQAEASKPDDHHEGIFWQSPINMVAFFVFGILTSCMHHLYYHFLDGKLVGNDSQQQWALRHSILSLSPSISLSAETKINLRLVY